LIGVLMRISGLILLMMMVLPVFAAGEAAPTQPVTVAQLEEMVAAGHQSDGDLARLLSGLDLTQRLSPERFKRLNEALPGRRSREALLVVADLSGFLDLPAADVDAGAPPEVAEQKRIVARALDYVDAATRRLPDFVVTRRLTRFEDLQVVRGVDKPVRHVPFRSEDRSTATTLFREGREVVEPTSANNVPKPGGLTDYGVFGVLLAVVSGDLRSGQIAFDHWERGAGRIAVFRFAVAESQSHYSVEFCCYLAADGWLRRYEANPRYHGELAIDAETGAILRLVLKTDLEPSPLLHLETDAEKPLKRADVLVEYGPVVIGGRTYICPLRSVSVMTTWSPGGNGPVSEMHFDAHGRVRAAAPAASPRAEYSRVTALNDYEFENHHLFRGDVRMMPGAVEGVPR
jgi:hypothetical protein